MRKLHLGCGPKIIDGFVNIDTRKLPGVDVVDDIRTLETQQNDSADLIYASHVLEHVGRLEYSNVLKRWFDVLKEGGTLRIGVPDMESVFVYYERNGDLEKLRGFIWGGQTYPENFHYIGWDYSTLVRDLCAVGFDSKLIRRYNWRETEHAHIDDFTQSYLPHMDKENGMLMSLNVEAKKPCKI